MVELYGADFAACHHAATVTAYMAFHAGDYLDAGAAVFKHHPGYDMFLGPIIDCLLLLLGAEAVRYTDISAETFVDIGHHPAEHGTVAGHIGRTEETYVVVDHLMDYGIVYLILGQVKAAAYPQFEIRILQTAVPLAVLTECAYAQVGLCVANHNRRFRELSVKHLAVKLPEPVLYVFFIRNH